MSPLIEPYFGTLYWVDELDDDLLLEWKVPPLNPRLQLPPKNNYLPQDFRLVSIRSSSSSPPNSRKAANGVKRRGSKDQEAKQELDCENVFAGMASPSFSQEPSNRSVPIRLLNEDGFQMWHVVDTQHRVPKSEIYISISSKAATSSFKNAALNDLLVRVINDAVIETVYMARMAELESSISSHDTGIKLHLSGFSDKALALLSYLLESVFNTEDILLVDRVSRQVDLYSRALQNENLKAVKCASNHRLYALKPSRISAKHKLYALDKILHVSSDNIIAELRSYVISFLSSVCIEGLIVGNISNDAALLFSTELFSRLNELRVAMSSTHRPSQSIVDLPVNKPLLLYVQPMNLKERNASIEAYFQLGKFDIVHLTYLDLLDQIVSESFFDELRTKQQLGYTVQCGVRETFGILAFCLQVVTSSHSLETAQTSIMNFVNTITENIQKLPEREFQSHVTALRDHYLQPHPSLAQAAEDFWSQVEERRYAFDHHLIQSSLLSSFVKADLITFCHSLFTTQRKLLVVHCAVNAELTYHEGLARNGALPFTIHSNAEDIHALGLYESMV